MGQQPPPPPSRTEENGYYPSSQVEGSNKYYYPSDTSYGYPSDTTYGYPPPGNNTNHEQYAQQQTPLPQRVSSVTAGPYGMPNHSAPPNLNAGVYSMPTPHYPQQQQRQDPVYPPPQYHHQRNLSQSTASPPSSPRFPQAQPYQTIVGYPSATQELIEQSYRPRVSHHMSDSSFTVSTPSTAQSTPPIYPPTSAGFRPPAAPQTSYDHHQPSQMQQQQQQQHRRTPSSLRNNVIMTIERPRYTYLPESGNMENEGEMPFIPVSPDTDSDEDEYFTRNSDQTRYDPTTANAVPPQVAPPQVVPQQPAYQQQYDNQRVEEHQHLQHHYPEQQHQSISPVPPPQNNYYEHQQVPQLPQMIEKEAPALPRHQPQPTQREEPQQIAAPVEEETRVMEPNYGLLSVLSRAFIRHVKGLEHVRELWCASEYNESFTGSEAVVKYNFCLWCIQTKTKRYIFIFCRLLLRVC